MSLLNPKCDHEREGHQLARLHVDYANCQHVAELAGGKVEGLSAADWMASKKGIQLAMADNLEACREAGHMAPPAKIVDPVWSLADQDPSAEETLGSIG